jgi:hypothetical protein
MMFFMGAAEPPKFPSASQEPLGTSLDAANGPPGPAPPAGAAEAQKDTQRL